MKTYTRFKLTDAQCKRLSQMYHGRPHLHGVALDALVRKGLAEPIPDHEFDGHTYGKVPDHRLTADGRLAYEWARAEGW